MKCLRDGHTAECTTCIYVSTLLDLLHELPVCGAAYMIYMVDIGFEQSCASVSYQTLVLSKRKRLFDFCHSKKLAQSIITANQGKLYKVMYTAAAANIHF